MIAQELERALHNAFMEARRKRHEVITTEHLLLGLLDCPTAREALTSGGVDIDGLRGRLARYIDTHSPRLRKDREVDTQPTLEFQRVIQDAILRTQVSGKEEVTCADVLSSIYKQKGSAAARLLGGAELKDGPETGDPEDFDEAPAEIAGATPEELERADELQIVMLNDDRTPMEFVMTLLQRFFSMNGEEAKDAMLEVHQQGKAVLGLYAREAAKDQFAQVAAYIMQHGHPLRCILVVPK